MSCDKETGADGGLENWIVSSFRTASWMINHGRYAEDLPWVNDPRRDKLTKRYISNVNVAAEIRPLLFCPRHLININEPWNLFENEEVIKLKIRLYSPKDKLTNGEC